MLDRARMHAAYPGLDVGKLSIPVFFGLASRAQRVHLELSGTYDNFGESAERMVRKLDMEEAMGMGDDER
jgi:hypothetical protein